MDIIENTKMLVRYKAWADDITFSAVSKLPSAEITKQRKTRFGNIVHTLNHVYVIDDIFKAHLSGEKHHYTARNTDNHPHLSDLYKSQMTINRWYIDYVDSLSEELLNTIVNFQFIGGGDGAMSRLNILLHVINHSTYHRGFVGDMFYQIPAIPPANDLPVFLRDIAEG